MNQQNCSCAASGYLRETSILQQVEDDLINAVVNSPSSRESVLVIEDIYFEFQAEKLTVLIGNNERNNFMLMSNLAYQHVFRQGYNCAVFCSDAKEFAKGQLALVSEVGLNTLNTGEVADFEWAHIVHAFDVIEQSTLYLAKTPTTFELLKNSIRQYASRCNKDRMESYTGTVIVLGMQLSADEMAKPDQIMSELKALANENGLHILLHQAIGNVQYANDAFSLQSSVDDGDDCGILSGYIKRDSSFIKAKLLFDANKFVVTMESGGVDGRE